LAIEEEDEVVEVAEVVVFEGGMIVCAFAGKCFGGFGWCCFDGCTGAAVMRDR